MDRAQEREQLDRDRAIDAARARIAESMLPRDPKAAEFCIDCDEPIEAERLLLVRRASRCAQCARDFEARLPRSPR
jgi:RNA polymerase-binding transcription factor DksA